jgi:hypothetical protein
MDEALIFRGFKPRNFGSFRGGGRLPRLPSMILTAVGFRGRPMAPVANPSTLFFIFSITRNRVRDQGTVFHICRPRFLTPLGPFTWSHGRNLCLKLPWIGIPAQVYLKSTGLSGVFRSMRSPSHCSRGGC